MIDCSHANSAKDHTRQPLVARDVAGQIRDGNTSIVGLMLESNLHAGSQKLGSDRSALRYGVSVTDPCIDWNTTEALLEELAATLAAPLRARQRTRSLAA
jgi:3-deoxy-7-phosphoheptulonate synthase